MKQKVLICGATGFVGRNMLESFIKNDAEREMIGHIRIAMEKVHSINGISIPELDLVNQRLMKYFGD